MASFSAEEFAGYGDVPTIVGDLRDTLKKKPVSDIVDDNEFQYVDLVMGGGAMLGPALAGYTYALEMAGIRFHSIGGTSAGSINALLLFAKGAANEAKSLDVLRHLVEMPAETFLDGKPLHVKWLKKFLQQRNEFSFLDKCRFALLAKKITESFGLIDGDEFEGWLAAQLPKCSWDEIKERYRKAPPGLQVREEVEDVDDQEPFDPNRSFAPELAIVCADISTGYRAVFERHRDLYFRKSESVSPARYVRASISVPGIFKPVILKNVPQGIEAQKLWRKEYNLPPDFTPEIPCMVHLSDGGLVSNFPIDLFHEIDHHMPRIPRIPTFGVKLGQERSRQITEVADYVNSIYLTVTGAPNRQLIRQHPEYRRLVKEIDTDDYNAFDVGMSLTAKLELFEKGVAAAKQFLKDFDWDAYKEFRIKLRECRHAFKP